MGVPTRDYVGYDGFMDLYHPEIRLPDGFVAPTERVTLKWTGHARRAAMNDRYGVIPEFATIPLCRFSVVEVGVEKGRVAKIVVRGHFDSERDIVFVLIPGDWTVKTVWFNLRTDSHKTLDKGRYVA